MRSAKWKVWLVVAADYFHLKRFNFFSFLSLSLPGNLHGQFYFLLGMPSKRL